MLKVPIQVKVLIVLIILSFAFVTTLKADYLRANANYCITDDWYFAKNPVNNKHTFYFRLSSQLEILRKASGTRQEQYLISGYEYNTTTGICKKSETTKSMSALGMEQSSYQFLMGLSGILVGFSLLTGLIIISSRR